MLFILLIVIFLAVLVSVDSYGALFEFFSTLVVDIVGT